MSRRGASFLVMALFCLSCFAAETKQTGCENGNGRVSEKFKRFNITSEPVPGDSRLCRAVISRKKEAIFATQAETIRLALLGQDMNGDGEPELALLADSGRGADCCSLHVVSLGKTPALLRTISKGSNFRVDDRDGDGLLEIWANETAFDGFDGLPNEQSGTMPPVALRLQGSRLGDASAQFAYRYDSAIASLRVGLQAERMKAFLAADGKLVDGSVSPVDLPKLLATKGLILGLVLRYLYSGRTGEAKAALGDLWPSADIDRTWSLIQKTRSGGITSQADFSFPPLPETEGCDSPVGSQEVHRVGRGRVTAPKPIKTPDPEYSSAAREGKIQGTVLLWVVICADGRVGRIRVERSLDDDLDYNAVRTVRQWKFQPALQDGKPVAVQVNIEVNFRLF